MSNELVSMTLAMVSESREVNTILKELFTPEGNELCVHPAARYLRCRLFFCRTVVSPVAPVFSPTCVKTATYAGSARR